MQSTVRAEVLLLMVSLFAVTGLLTAGCNNLAAGYPGGDDYCGPHGGIEEGEEYGGAFFMDSVSSFAHRSAQAYYVEEVNTTYGVYKAFDRGQPEWDDPEMDDLWASRTPYDTYAYAFDHSERRVIGPSRVGHATNSPRGLTVTVDGDGYIHVFFDAHNSTIQYARSAEPYRIEDWIHPPSGKPGSGDLPMVQGTYLSSDYNEEDNAVYLTYRGGLTPDGSHPHTKGTLARSPLDDESVENGAIWENVNDNVLDSSDAPGRHFDCYMQDLQVMDDGRVHLSWYFAHGDSHDGPRQNVYHAAYNPESGRMENACGKNLGTTVTYEDAVNYCMVKDTPEPSIRRGYDVGADKDSLRHFRLGYAPETDTAFIGVSYGIGEETSYGRVYSYEGISEGDGNWEESPVIVEQSPPTSVARLRVNEAGQPELNTHEQGIYVRKPDGSWKYRPIEGGFGGSAITRPSIDEFSFPVMTSEQNLTVYGKGMAGSATHPRPPRKLRVEAVEGSTVALNWDLGLAGPSGLERFTIYVDGSQHTVLREGDGPSGWNAPIPATVAKIDIEDGDGGHEIYVTLTNHDGTESAPSNTVSVSF